MVRAASSAIVKAGTKSPVDLPLRLDDAARRPQLHRANISKHRFRNQEGELRLGRRIVR